MTTHVINAHGGVDDIFDAVGNPIGGGPKPEKGDRCLSCAEFFEPGQRTVTFDTWAVNPKEGLNGVHFHARCAEEFASSLIQDVARLVDKEDVGLHTAYRHKQISSALATLLVAGAPKAFARKAKWRLTK